MASTKEEKLGRTMSLLIGKGYSWCNIVKQWIAANRLTWNFFLKTFKKRFMGEQYIEARKREFINLVQGEMFIAEYEAKFVRLNQYIA